MSVSWNYFEKFAKIIDTYMPVRGEGETRATQIVTAVNKLIFKWYNDGDVYDNTHYLEGWCNDLSSYANWLRKYTSAGHILDAIDTLYTHGAYEDLLKDLADELLVAEDLAELNSLSKQGSIYDCKGPFRFAEYDEDEDNVYDEDEEWGWEGMNDDAY